MKKRIFSLVLVLLMFVQMTACGTADSGSATSGGDPAAAVGETEAVQTAEAEETVRSEVRDSLPDDLGFDGTQINFIIRPEFALYDATGESSGDIVYDAVYNRNLTVEERLDVKLNYIMTADNDFSKMADQVSNSIMSGLDEYDVVMQRGIQTFTQSVQGLYMDLSDAPYIDTERPWWWMNIVDSTSVNTDKTYYLTGDLSISTFLLSTVCFVNKEMLENYGLTTEGLYDLVENGEWTYERFEEYCQNVYTDTNGDGTADADDVYAFSYLGYGAQWFNYSAGLKFSGRDADGYPTLEINNENTIKLLETLNHMWHDNNYGYMEPSGDYTVMVQKFMGEENLFLMGRFMHTANLRDFEKEYGVVPYPKLDESYDYISGTGSSGNFLSVPTTCADFDATCAVLEALSAENYRNVFPVFYESALKIKYVSNNRDAQMIDIIHDSIYVDFLLLSGMNNIIDTLLQNNDNDFASAYAAQEKVLAKTLKTLIEAYDELD